MKFGLNILSFLFFCSVMLFLFTKLAFVGLLMMYDNYKECKLQLRKKQTTFKMLQRTAKTPSDCNLKVIQAKKETRALIIELKKAKEKVEHPCIPAYRDWSVGKETESVDLCLRTTGSYHDNIPINITLVYEERHSNLRERTRNLTTKFSYFTGNPKIGENFTLIIKPINKVKSDITQVIGFSKLQDLSKNPFYCSLVHEAISDLALGRKFINGFDGKTCDFSKASEMNDMPRNGLGVESTIEAISKIEYFDAMILNNKYFREKLMEYTIKSEKHSSRTGFYYFHDCSGYYFFNQKCKKYGHFKKFNVTLDFWRNCTLQNVTANLNTTEMYFRFYKYSFEHMNKVMLQNCWKKSNTLNMIEKMLFNLEVHKGKICFYSNHSIISPILNNWTCKKPLSNLRMINGNIPFENEKIPIKIFLLNFNLGR